MGVPLCDVYIRTYTIELLVTQVGVFAACVQLLLVVPISSSRVSEPTTYVA